MAKGSQHSRNGGQLSASCGGRSNRQSCIRYVWPSQATEGKEQLGRGVVRFEIPLSIAAAPSQTFRAVEHIRHMRGGAQSHLMGCSDGDYYVVKFQKKSRHHRILANEFVGTKLAALLRLPYNGSRDHRS